MLHNPLHDLFHHFDPLHWAHQQINHLQQINVKLTTIIIGWIESLIKIRACRPTYASSFFNLNMWNCVRSLWILLVIHLPWGSFQCWVDIQKFLISSLNINSDITWDISGLMSNQISLGLIFDSFLSKGYARYLEFDI